MDVESHLTRYFENEDFGKDTENFVSVLFSNNTQQVPISLAKWTSLSPEKQAKYCLGNEKVALIIRSAIEQSNGYMYATDDEIKDLLENYLYVTYYPYYSGASKAEPKLKELPANFVKSFTDLIKAATCNSILRNHMNKKSENIGKVFSAIEQIGNQEESGK